VPRKPRKEIAGGIHHVFARGNAGEQIYLDSADRASYLIVLGATVSRTGWRCLSYCLMDNHVHMLVETPAPNLGTGMQRLHGDYAREFNRRHRRYGHLFQGRYGAVLVQTDEQLWTTVSYIARNPVEAGMCERPHEWVWSSHCSIAGFRQPPPWLDVTRLLTLFEAFGGDSRQLYLECASPTP
jgi:REP element-mobilizing transposase RayT